MSNNQYLKLRRSAVPGKIPDTSSIDFGEIALNTYDGLAFIKKSGSNGEEIVAIGATSATASYALFALSSSNALTASYALNAGTTIDTGSFATTGSNIFIGNQTISGSVTSTVGFTGSLFGTSSYSITASYVANSSIQYVTNSVDTLSLNQIEVADYDNNVAVTFTNGRLKFIFGTPVSQSITSFSYNGTFSTDRFNKVVDGYTASAVWTNGGYDLVSASIYENRVLVANTGSGTTLTYLTDTTGSRTYVLEVTSSSPLDGTIVIKSSTLTGTLSKSNPGNPSVSSTATVQLGATSNQIEQGATGSIAFTTASGAANSWAFVYLTSSLVSPYFVTGSATGSTSIVLSATSSYSSSGVNGSDNSPALVTTLYGTSTYTKIRSLRAGAATASSFTAADIQNLSLWDTTLGGNIGTISKGTTNPSGQSVTITWTDDKYHYIIYDSSRSNLTNITAAGFSVFSAFALTTVGSYKVYKTTALQSGYAGQSITYVLT